MDSDAQALAASFKEFAYVTSHDLGTPIRAMVEFSRLLKAENPKGLSKDAQTYLNFILDNGEKAQAMLAGLLEYSRLNTVTMPFASTDCNALLKECQAELVGRSLKLTADPLPVVESDANQMKKLFRALLANAATFHAPHVTPDIAVSARRDEGDWVFSVRDNGIGIDPKFHERIFQPFKRLHTDREFPGVGMGLTLAQKVVDRHGGRIWVDSAPGEGAMFLFSIPAEKAA